jgi:diaminohydroxyphosphoribosylaminopyrimidine deaminase/5-amino-6-(5-phosphoribosylamino)uracil reductase
VLFLHTSRASARARAALAKAGADALEVPSEGDGIDITAALVQLGAREFRSLMVEGGGRLIGAFMRARAWQELWIYRAPIVLGEGRPAVAGLELESVADAERLQLLRRRMLGEDELCIYTR